MPSFKSPSSRRFLERMQGIDTTVSSREVLALRREQHQHPLEVRTAAYVVAMPKHPKAGRMLSNPNSTQSLTKRLKGNMYDARKLTRQVDIVLGPSEKSPSTKGMPRYITSIPIQ